MDQFHYSELALSIDQTVHMQLELKLQFHAFELSLSSVLNSKLVSSWAQAELDSIMLILIAQNI